MVKLQKHIEIGCSDFTDCCPCVVDGKRCTRRRICDYDAHKTHYDLAGDVDRLVTLLRSDRVNEDQEERANNIRFVSEMSVCAFCFRAGKHNELCEELLGHTGAEVESEGRNVMEEDGPRVPEWLNHIDRGAIRDDDKDGYASSFTLDIAPPTPGQMSQMTDRLHQNDSGLSTQVSAVQSFGKGIPASLSTPAHRSATPSPAVRNTQQAELQRLGMRITQLERSILIETAPAVKETDGRDLRRSGDVCMGSRKYTFAVVIASVLCCWCTSKEESRQSRRVTLPGV